MRERIGLWQGLVLAGVLVGATLWLGATGRLALYIHPRYVEFTMIMAAVAAAFVVAGVAFAWGRGRGGGAHMHDHAHPHDHGHAHDHAHAHDSDDVDGDAHGDAHGGADARRRRRGRLAAAGAVAGSVAVAVATVLALVIVPPATLSSATAADRDMNAGAPVLADDELISVGGDFSSFTVKDWASVLGQISSPEFFEGATVDAVGFVTPDAADPENVYFVSRFIVTCCAVDAQPVGVPVHDPGWAADLAENEWVRVSGPLVANPGAGVEGAPPIVVDPTAVDVVEEPADPYVH